MRKFAVIIVLILATLSMNAQWEKTNWRSDPKISIDCVSGDIIIIRSSDDGFLLSTDSGDSWKPIHYQLTGTNAVAILDNNIFIGGYDFLFVSTDMGNSWESRMNGLYIGIDVNKIVVLDRIVFAGTNKGIFMTSDTGKTWIAKNKGITDNKIIMQDLTYCGKNLFACTYYNLYFSSNMGDSWEIRNNGITLQNLDDKFAVTGENIYLGIYTDTFNVEENNIYLSTDMGNSWILKSNNPMKNKYSYSFDAVDNVIIACSNSQMYDSVYYSSDMGDNWSTRNSGLPIQLQQGIETFGISGNNLFTSSGSELYLSTDKGDTWNAKIKSLNYGAVHALAVIGGTIYAGASPAGRMSTFQDGLYASTDLGVTWVPKGLKDKLVQCIEFADNNIFAGTNHGICISTDQSNTWETKNCGLPDDNYIWSLTYHQNTIFTNYRRLGMKASSDMGMTWVDKNYGLPVPKQRVHSVASNGNYLFAGMDSAVYISSDMGENWVKKNNGLPDSLLIISQFAFQDDNIYILTRSAIYFSSDIGESWISISDGLPAWDSGVHYSCKILLDGNMIFACLTNSQSLGGVYFSTDNGANWIPKNNGITNFNYNVSSLAILGDYIFAGTSSYQSGEYGDKIYKATLSDIVSVEAENTKDNIFSISPNPATDYIEISGLNRRVNPTVDDPANFRIYNVLGEIVSSVVLQNLGSQRIEISDLPPGMYFVWVGDNVKKFVKI